jgi:lysophospholipase L1-like esterase
MVGSLHSGNFKDPDHEGWSGMTITQVNEQALKSLDKYKPNIAAILVGTNDMGQGKPNAPENMGKLIDSVLNRPWQTMVVVSTLPPNKNATISRRVDAFNKALCEVVKKRTDKGKWVVLVDSHAVVPVKDLADGIHPNDKAFERMARVFYEGIKSGEKKGWLAPLARGKK